MSTLRRLDAWLGKHVMHPPIIWVCQRTGWTQNAFYRYAWWIVALWSLHGAANLGWFMATLLIVFALVRTISAAMDVNAPTMPSLALRAAFVALLVLDVVTLPIGNKLYVGDLGTLLALFAEFAATIVTIPPRREREGSTGRALARR